MSTLSDILPEIIAHAKAQFPHECAGIIGKTPDGSLKLYKGRNTIEDETLATNNFVLDSASFAAVYKDGNEVEMIYHSHPFTPPVPSLADRYACKRSGYPWLIVNPNTEEYTITDPYITLPEAPILGRSFVWGSWDCYGLLRDIYKIELSIELEDVDRGVFGLWDTDQSWDRFTDSFQKLGFVQTNWSHSKDPSQFQFKKYDVLLQAVMSDTGKPNHCAVMMEPDAKIFYHHLVGRESEKAVFGGLFAQMTTAVVRHYLLM